MKKAILLFFVLLLTLQSGFASAEKTVYIDKLIDQTPARWTQVYEAHGRVIDIDVPIEIPAVEVFPVLLGGKKDSSVSNNVVEYYSKLEHTFEEIIYKNDFYSFTVAVNNPSRSLEGESRPNEMTLEHDFEYFNADWDQAYAESNPLRLTDAFEILKKETERCYAITADEEFVVNYIVLNDALKEYDRKTKTFGKWLNDMGSYTINCFQTFHGIPLLCPISASFKSGGADAALAAPYRLDFTIKSDDSFNLYFGLLQEESELHRNVPLCTFETIKKQLVDLIDKGQVRAIHTARLGYVCFAENMNYEKLVFFPCWVVECDYYDSAKKEYAARDFPIPVRKTSQYTKLIFNAQTGEMFDRDSKAKNRSITPQIMN